MRFPPTFLEEIKTRLPCSTIVGRTVRLKKAGREWRGLSPFNSEKTPSFFVNDQKARWFDMSAGRDGDVFGFLMQVRGLSFQDAVAELAKEAGLELPKADAESVKREERRHALVDVLELARNFFQSRLSETPAARAYLDGRKIGADQVEQFGIGYAPADRSSLKMHLAAKGVDPAMMLDAGLIVAGDDIPVPYDRFRDRLMFPIADQKGRTIAFSGRDLSGKSPAKYHNSPETDVFHKGRTLYNHHAAIQPAWDGAPTITVEGYFGTMASCAAGYPATVGTMGTAVTEDHLLQLWRLSDEPVVCLDGDAAGERAVKKVIASAFPLLTPGRSLKFAFNPPGQDPHDVVISRGREAFQSIVDRAAPMVDVFWRAWSRPCSSPEQYAGLEKELFDVITTIPDEPTRRNYFQNIRDRLRAMPRRTRVTRSNGASNHSASPGAFRLVNGIVRAPGLTLKEASVIACLVAAPDVALEAIETVAAIPLSPEARSAADRIMGFWIDHPDAIGNGWARAMNEAGLWGLVDDAYKVVHNAGVSSLDPVPAFDKSLALEILNGN